MEDVYFGSLLYSAFANRSLLLFHLKNSNFSPGRAPLERATVLHRLKDIHRFEYVKNHPQLLQTPPRNLTACNGVRNEFRGTRPPFCCDHWHLCHMVRASGRRGSRRSKPQKLRELPP